MPTADPTARRRLPAAVRRAQVLEAAVAAFAEGGYAGTTTDQVATRAGVSQPYVVRMFGTKQALFLAVHEQVIDRVVAAFRTAVAAAPPGVTAKQEMGRAYVRLTADRVLLRVMQHGFVAGADPVVGPAVRAGLLRVFREIRELTGVSSEEATTFLADGMLINTLLSVEMERAADDPDAAALLRCVLDPHR